MDIELSFVEAGCGTPLILLHGNGEDHTYFVHQIRDFANGHHIYAVDTRGHGASPRGSAPVTIVQFARDLLDFMDARGLERADILGFSDGGNIALTFALRHPERVGRLVLNGANLDPGGVRLPVQAPIVLGYWLCALSASSGARAHRELLGLMVREPHIPSAMLKALPMPVLVIAGTRDMIRESHSRLIAESIPKGELVLLPGDHFIANKSPAAFNRAVRAFWKRTEPFCKEASL